ncbi:MAG TPA: type II toxin-antitoxin system RelE/ParE family toxin [Gemmatimonadaceae bacterium]
MTADADPEFLEFVYLRSYERSTRAFSGPGQREALEDALESAPVENPDVGVVIPDAGGLRKVRVALMGRGKSGGARVIYFHRRAKRRVYVLLAYSKNAKSDLTPAERQIMQQLMRSLEGES